MIPALARDPRRLPSRNIVLVAVAMLLVVATVLDAGEWPWSMPLASPQRPHPAVVRVTVEESDGMAHGSGSLIDVRDRFGIVITNWHVVRDAAGPINVEFPDGFRSAARVLRVDRDWDLAALLIWRPHVSPIPIAAQAPRPGEPLTIAGYGAGNYRSSTGRCTQYVAPSDHHPFEMVEVAANARQGDSGGPIFNASGELAGVLFGSDGGTTSGSYAGRVHQFLSTAWPPNQESDFPQAIAATSRTRKPHPIQRLPKTGTSSDPSGIAPMTPLPETGRQLASVEDRPTPRSDSSVQERVANAELRQTHAASFTWQDVAGDSILQQCKTFLAILGLFTLLAHITRLLTPRES